MDFELPEELKMVQSLARAFVKDQLRPMERTLLGRSANLSDAQIWLPAEIEVKLIELARKAGLWGIGVPEEYGGAGLNVLGNCVVEEQLAQTVVPFDFGNVSPFLFDGNVQQREKYLRPVLNRSKRAYVALAEPEKSPSLLDFSTKAEKANGYYILQGRKVSFSRLAEDYFAIVFASTKDRVTCFLVDKDTPGFIVKGGEEKSGWQSQTRQSLVLEFDDCKVPLENVLGEEGKAFSLGKYWLPNRRIIRGSQCTGIAQRLLDEATIHVQSWESFGLSISKWPGIQACLTDIAMDLHACRLMVFQAACKADKGELVRDEASMIKLFSTQMINNVVDNMAHIYNGPAYVKGLPVDKLCRNALMTNMSDLSLELQRSIIAKNILKGLQIS